MGGTEEDHFPFHENDLIYRHHKKSTKENSNAVIFFVMDISGSMTKQKKFLARSFYFLLYQYLNHRYENLEIVLSCIIMKPNLDEILDIVKFVDQLKQVDRVFFQVISQPMGLNFDYNWYKDKKFCFLWPDKDKAARIIDELITLKKNGSKIANSLNHLRYFKYYFLNPNKYIKDNRCNAEDLGMEIGIDGNVSICNKMRNLGSLKKHSISELLAMNYKSIAGEISNCSLNCHQVMNCRFSEE